MSTRPINYSFENSHPITSKIVPTWTNYQGLTTTQKIEKIIADIFKTLLCCSIILPLFTFSIDHFIKTQTDKAPAIAIKKDIVDFTKGPSDPAKSTAGSETIATLPVAEKHSAEKTLTLPLAPSNDGNQPKEIEHNSSETSASTAIINTVRKIKLITNIYITVYGLLCIAQGIGILSKPFPAIPFSHYDIYLPGRPGVMMGATSIGFALIQQLLIQPVINKIIKV